MLVFKKMFEPPEKQKFQYQLQVHITWKICYALRIYISASTKIVIWFTKNRVLIPLLITIKDRVMMKHDCIILRCVKPRHTVSQWKFSISTAFVDLIRWLFTVFKQTKKLYFHADIILLSCCAAEKQYIRLH